MSHCARVFPIARRLHGKFACVRSATNSLRAASADSMASKSEPQDGGSIDLQSAPSTSRALRTRDIPACAQHLIHGGLVAFPTETVYGLGCHALDATAIQSVFDAKERPLTDPLIVHVLCATDAFALWDATASNGAKDDTHAMEPKGHEANHLEETILTTLCTHFWPGPLTLVAKAAANVVPLNIMAGTGFCAIRSPRHVTARALLEAANIPIAAPSANKFGHVSPTTANHVWDDLHDEPVWILEDDTASPSRTHATCEVGVESTVAKVEARISDETASARYVVTVLRQGAVSVHDLTQCLATSGLRVGIDVDVTCNKKQVTPDHVATVAPGQLLRHYSPNVPSFLVSSSCIQQYASLPVHSLETTVVLDFGGQLKSWESSAMAYRDFSSSGDSTEAAQTVFDTLRWAEQIAGAERILFPDLEIDAASNDALRLALKDRLTRAASGNFIREL